MLIKESNLLINYSLMLSSKDSLFDKVKGRIADRMIISNKTIYRRRFIAHNTQVCNINNKKVYIVT